MLFDIDDLQHDVSEELVTFPDDLEATDVADLLVQQIVSIREEMAECFERLNGKFEALYRDDNDDACAQKTRESLLAGLVTELQAADALDQRLHHVERSIQILSDELLVIQQEEGNSVPSERVLSVASNIERLGTMKRERDVILRFIENRPSEHNKDRNARSNLASNGVT